MSSQQNNDDNNSNTNNNNQTGLVAGHAEYIKGAVEAAIGSFTGSHAWASSGEQDKAHATSKMKAAGQPRDATSQGYGQVEETAGKVFGCDGMKAEGAASKTKEDKDDREIQRA